VSKLELISVFNGTCVSVVLKAISMFCLIYVSKRIIDDDDDDDDDGVLDTCFLVGLFTANNASCNWVNLSCCRSVYFSSAVVNAPLQGMLSE